MARASLVSHSHGKDLDGPNVREGAPSLFDVPLPSSPTQTQVEAAERLAPYLKGLQRRILACVHWAGRAGVTPWEVSKDEGLNIVTVRARFTELHQSGQLIRVPRCRGRQHVYVTRYHWSDEMGSVPSRRHKGQR